MPLEAKFVIPGLFDLNIMRGIAADVGCPFPLQKGKTLAR
jgi:hypothetical protein